MQWAAAPLASLFLILSLCAFSMKPAATGEMLFPAQILPSQDCGDGNPIFFLLKSDGQAIVNRQLMPVHQAFDRISREMDHRAERSVYISADPEVSVDEVVHAINQMLHDTPDLILSAFTTSQRRRFEAADRLAKPNLAEDVGCVSPGSYQAIMRFQNLQIATLP